MIDKGRTKYALLTEAEIDKCSDLSVKWCNVESPLFPVNLCCPFSHEVSWMRSCT